MEIIKNELISFSIIIIKVLLLAVLTNVVESKYKRK
jgi:hypothetical protein